MNPFGNVEDEAGAIKILVTARDKRLRRIGRGLRDRECGDCTVCCTVMSVEDVTEANTPCKNQCEAGCAVYEDRPHPCKVYSCYWRLGCGPEEARPDRCGVHVDMAKSPHGVLAYVRNFLGNFKMGPVRLLLQDVEYAGFAKGFGLMDPSTSEGQPIVCGRTVEAYLPAYERASKGETYAQIHGDIRPDERGRVPSHDHDEPVEDGFRGVQQPSGSGRDEAGSQDQVRPNEGQ